MEDCLYLTLTITFKNIFIVFVKVIIWKNFYLNYTIKFNFSKQSYNKTIFVDIQTIKFGNEPTR